MPTFALVPSEKMNKQVRQRKEHKREFCWDLQSPAGRLQPSYTTPWGWRRNSKQERKNPLPVWPGQAAASPCGQRSEHADPSAHPPEPLHPGPAS